MVEARSPYGLEDLSPFAYEVICSVSFPRNLFPQKQDKNGSWCGEPMVHIGFEVVPISLVHWVPQLVFGIVQYWSRLEQ